MTESPHPPPEGKPRPSGLLRTLWGIAIATPASCLVILVYLYGVDVPVYDQWSMVRDFDKFYAGDWSFSELLRSHNGHRIFFPRLILIPLGHLTGWNTRVEMGLSIVLALLTFLVLARSAASTMESHGQSRWHPLVLVISIAVFSLNQWENWLWGLQMHVFLNVFGVAGGLYLLSRPTLTLGRLLGAGLLGTVATFSHGGGLVFWLIAAVLILSLHFRKGKKDKALFAVWGLATAGIYTLYLRDLPSASTSQFNSPFDIFSQPFEYIYYVLTLLGAPVVSFSGSVWPPRDSGIAFATGLTGIMTLLVMIWFLFQKHRLPIRSVAHFLSLTAYSLAVAGMIGMTRFSIGPEQAMASRYTTVITPFWISFIVLLESSRRRLELKRGAQPVRFSPSRVLGAGMLGLVGLMVASSLHSMPIFPVRSKALKLARAEMARCEIEGFIKRLHVNTNVVCGSLGTLRKYHLSVFRDADEQIEPPARPVPLEVYSQLISVLSELDELPAGRTSKVRIRVTNPSLATWPAEGDGFGTYAVRLAYHWFDAQGAIVVFDGVRTLLPHDLKPGESVELDAQVIAPDQPGRYLLRWNMVQEAVTWFDSAGASPLDIPVEVLEHKAFGPLPHLWNPGAGG